MKTLYSSYFKSDEVFARVKDWDGYVVKSEHAIDSLDPVDELRGRWNLAKIILEGGSDKHRRLLVEWLEFATSQGFEFKHPAKNGYFNFQDELDQIREESLMLVRRAVFPMCKFEDEEDDMIDLEVRDGEFQLVVDLDYVDEKYHKYFS